MKEFRWRIWLRGVFIGVGVTAYYKALDFSAAHVPGWVSALATLGVVGLCLLLAESLIWVMFRKKPGKSAD